MISENMVAIAAAHASRRQDRTYYGRLGVRSSDLGHGGGDEIRTQCHTRCVSHCHLSYHDTASQILLRGDFSFQFFPKGGSHFFPIE